MNDHAEQTADQVAAFQRIWAESMSKLMQTAFTYGSGSAPPDVLREIRSGLFQALGKSWEEFMRSPEFLESMKQWMDQAVTFRQMGNDVMAHMRNELQGGSRQDIDAVMLAVRHMERRLLDRVEELSAEVRELKQRVGNHPPGPSRRGTAPAARKPPKRRPETRASASRR